MPAHHQHENRQPRLVVFFQLGFDSMDGGPQLSLQSIVFVEANQFLRRCDIGEAGRVTIDDAAKRRRFPDRIVLGQTRGQAFNVGKIADRGRYDFGMSGDLFYYLQDNAQPRFARVVFEFENGARLAYDDMRLFGVVDVTPDPLPPFVRATEPPRS